MPGRKEVKEELIDLDWDKRKEIFTNPGARLFLPLTLQGNRRIWSSSGPGPTGRRRNSCD
jgi:hypothetical protein